MRGIFGTADRHPWLVAGLFFVLQVALRSPGLGESSLWLDEAIFLLWSRLPVSVVVRLAWSDANPPLYPLGLGIWVDVFGTSEVSARLPSLLLSAAGGSSLWLLGRRWVSTEAGLYAAAFFTASSLGFHYGREARIYALLPVLSVASFHLFFRTLRRPTTRSVVALALVNATGAYAHFTVAFVFLAQLVGALGWARARPRGVAAYLASQVLALVLFLPWASRVFANAPVSGRSWLGSPGWREGGQTAIALAGGEGALVAVVAVGAVVGIGGLLGARSTCAERRRRAAAIAAWALVGPLAAFCVSQWVSVFLPRYLIGTVPGLLLLAAWAVTALPLGSASRAAVAAGLVLLEALSLPTAAAIPKPDWRGASAIAREAHAAGDRVVVQQRRHCTPFGYHFASDAFRGPQRLLRRLRRAGVSCVDDLGHAFRGDGEEETRRILLVRARPRSTPLVPPGGFEIVSTRELAGLDLAWMRPVDRERSAPE